MQKSRYVFKNIFQQFNIPYQYEITLQLKNVAMTKEEFNVLEINERAAQVWSKGNFVDERVIYGKYHIKMYAMKDFFVEVWIDLKKWQIEKVHAIESETDWSGYLSSIKVSDLF